MYAATLFKVVALAAAAVVLFTVTSVFVYRVVQCVQRRAPRVDVMMSVFAAVLYLALAVSAWVVMARMMARMMAGA